jgi:hypothetical protein
MCIPFCANIDSIYKLGHLFGGAHAYVATKHDNLYYQFEYEHQYNITHFSTDTRWG